MEETRDRRGKGVKSRKTEKYRLFNNKKFQSDLDYLYSLIPITMDFSLLERGSRALASGNRDEFDRVILSMRGENIKTVIDINVAGDLAPELDGEPLGTRSIERENVILRPTSDIDIYLKQPLELVGRCDPAECEKCTPLSYPQDIKVNESSVVIYAGPGSGKTELIKSVPKPYRGRIFDTDHMKPGQVVIDDCVVVTNRPDILVRHKGLRLAFIPYQRHWMELCSSKCPSATQQWFSDMCQTIRDCYVIRRNSYLSDCVRLRVGNTPKKRDKI